MRQNIEFQEHKRIVEE